MLKIRLIPTLLWKQFGLVKGKSFKSDRRVGPYLPAIKVYNQRDVDELIFLDILGYENNHEIDYDMISNIGYNCFVPLTIGGGITKIDQVQKLLRNGADKISLNTSVYTNKNLISQIAKKNGTQCVVISIDVRKKNHKEWICYSHSGQFDTGIEVSEWAKEVEALGAGEILLTSIDNDGTMKGYDLNLIEKIANTVNIPLIASGGAGKYDDFVKAVKEAGASSVAAASIFHFTEQTPAEAKTYMKTKNIDIRSNYTSYIS